MGCITEYLGPSRDEYVIPKFAKYCSALCYYRETPGSATRSFFCFFLIKIWFASWAMNECQSEMTFYLRLIQRRAFQPCLLWRLKRNFQFPKVKSSWKIYTAKYGLVTRPGKQQKKWTTFTTALSTEQELTRQVYSISRFNKKHLEKPIYLLKNKERKRQWVYLDGNRPLHPDNNSNTHCPVNNCELAGIFQQVIK